MKSSALALDRDPSSRFLPWILAALSLVVAVAVGVAFALTALTTSWGEIGSDRLTVRIADTGEQASLQARDTAARLVALPDVQSARLLHRSEVADLLAPWMGAAGGTSELPLPWIIDVTLASPAAIRSVEAELAATENAVVDSTRGWLEPLRQLAGLSGVVAAALAGLSVAVIALVTVFSARAALTAHARTVELLRLMGAEERFIARRFQYHSLKQGLLGGLAGAVPGIAIVALGVGAARLDGSNLLSGLSPTLTGWVVMASLPALIALVAMLTARFTVLEMLRNKW